MIACSQQLTVIGNRVILITSCRQTRLQRKRKIWYNKTQTIAIAHLQYMWGGGELGETDNTDCGGQGVWLPYFNTSVSTNQNGMLLALAAYITEEKRQFIM